MIGVGISITALFPVLGRQTSLRREQTGDVTVLSIGVWEPRVTREENGNVVVG
ncbi:hypothetical protein [Shimia sp. MMG029]|uniref:hypothetical protein n=1 Tax=Shimia sp. MMG029 TaxID=3021978 RepID=UPI0022FE750A|nr:hypothetical protein [Shimia sp. MMG029]MDA5555731.1 hypothetical protein [Shimia sp. MMG029]